MRNGMDRRTFLKGLGVAGGTALGLGSLSLYNVSAANSQLRYGLNARDIRRLDPMAGPNSIDKTVLEHIYSGLVRPVPGTVNLEQIESDLAVNWEQSPDKKSWTFELRKGVEFHQGFGEFSADDVVFSLNRARDQKTSRYYKSYEVFDQIKALDRYTVRVELKAPTSALSFLPTILDWQSGMIMSRRAVEKFGDKIGNNPVGTGPFAFKEHIPQERVTVVRNDSYFRGKPRIESIVFRFLPDSSSRTLAFKGGELDIVEVVREKRAINQIVGPNIVVESYGPPTVMALHMNRTHKPLDDIRVRQALAYAVDREAIVQFVGTQIAVPLYSVVPPNFVGGLEEVPKELRYDHDPEKAKSLLAEAGFPKGFTIDPVFITERDFIRRPLEIMQEQWRRIGVNINLNVISHAAWHTKNDEGSNPLVYRAATRFPSANLILEEFFLGGGKRNFSHFTGADQAIREAQSETDPEGQKKLWREAQTDVLADLAAYPTHYLNAVTARKASVDLGYELDSALCICIPIKWDSSMS